jgi:hypothetical protein
MLTLEVGFKWQRRKKLLQVLKLVFRGQELRMSKRIRKGTAAMVTIIDKYSFNLHM